MDDTNPMVQALKARPRPQADPQDLLEFILANYNLTPKEQGNEEAGEENEPMDVQTQESHVP